ncbi:Mitochondrial Carrier (MC) Family [Phytophthora cinnamomi]|uniref:Mitochondrial Carrier (MC) Family n=1 Tax=Phytophthora cinnamomi TaxID=4785 RepID=UPI00355995A0|nr:Mitochondrial Carrier (MC) Family [Phytophthora cinnamomi]
MSWLDVAKDLNAGTIGGVAGIIAGHPLDTIKVQLQTSRGSGSGVLRTLRRVVGSEGAAGLYRGLLSPILSNAPINAVIFGVQGQSVRALQSTQNQSGPLTNSQHFVAGSAAGLVQVVFAAPSEHVKIQLQTGAIGAEHSSIAAARTILRRYGMSTLFRGWEVCLLRDVPSFGVYFCCYEATKRALTNGNSDNETDWKLMTAGGIAGMLSWAVCMPLDVVKSCVQGQSLEGKQMTMTEVARTRMRQEGPWFFFKGFGATMVRAFPVSAVTFLVYEKTMQLTS